MSVWLVLQDEDNVSRDVVRGGVSFLGEGDLGAFLPTSLDDDVQDLVLAPHRSPVRVQPPAGDLHPLCGTVVDFLQRNFELVNHRGILHLPAHVDGLRVPPVDPVEAIEAKTAESTEGIVAVVVHIHAVLVVKAVEDPGPATAEEDVEGVGAPKEGGEGGVRVSMEGVVEGASRRTRGTTTRFES